MRGGSGGSAVEPRPVGGTSSSLGTCSDLLPSLPSSYMVAQIGWGGRLWRRIWLCLGLLPSLLHGGADLAVVAPPGVFAPWTRNGLVGGLENGLTGRLSYFIFLID